MWPLDDCLCLDSYFADVCINTLTNIYLEAYMQHICSLVAGYSINANSPEHKSDQMCSVQSVSYCCCCLRLKALVLDSTRALTRTSPGLGCQYWKCSDICAAVWSVFPEQRVNLDSVLQCYLLAVPPVHLFINWRFECLSSPSFSFFKKIHKSRFGSSKTSPVVGWWPVILLF